MAGAMRKMAVYLGLVEDDGYDGRGFDPDDDFEPELDPEPERDRRRHEPSHQSHQVLQPERDESVRSRAVLGAARLGAPIHFAGRGIGASRAHRARGIHHTRTRKPGEERTGDHAQGRVGTRALPDHHASPRTYNEARTIGEHFREGTPVIMNLTEMDDTDAKRLVDFAAGLVFGLHGSIERVTQKVFLLSPANVDVTAEDKARIAEGGFFNQS